MSALFVFLPTNIWEDTEVDVQSHPPVQLLEGGCSKTKRLPLVNPANIRMVLGRSHPSINQWIQQLFIRNRWCARYPFRLHFFLSRSPPKRTCGSFRTLGQIPPMKAPSQPQTHWHSWDWEIWKSQKQGFFDNSRLSIVKCFGFLLVPTRHLQIHLTLIPQGD